MFLHNVKVQSIVQKLYLQSNMEVFAHRAEPRWTLTVMILHVITNIRQINLTHSNVPKARTHIILLGSRIDV